MYRNLTAGFVFGLMVLGLNVSTRADSTSPTPSGTTTPTSTTANKKTILSQLQRAHELLVNADHDYDGHRAKAAEEVHAALKEVAGKKHAAKSTAAKTAAKSEKNMAHHEAQGSSDDQLKEALSILKSVESEVSSKHPKASGNVSKAVSELHTALKIK